MTSPLPLSAPARFALIIDGLKRAVAEKIADYPWTGPMVVYVYRRLHRINAIFQTLAALIAAGKLPPEQVCRPRAAGVRTAVPSRPVTPSLFRTGTRGWLRPCRAWRGVLARRSLVRNCSIFSRTPR